MAKDVSRKLQALRDVGLDYLTLGQPLSTLEAVVALIANTTTTAGLKVRAVADQKYYPTGIKVTDEEMEALTLTKDEFHGEWNYVFKPRPSAPKK